MNTNQKKLKLIVHGLKASTLNNLTESQVDVLFGKLQEQGVQPQKVTKTITQTVLPPGSETMVGNVSVANKGGKTTVTPVAETDNVELDEKFESKKQQKYFFAKCGDGKTKEQKKWCKMADEFTKKTNFAKLPEKKKETKEEFNFGDYGKKLTSTVSKLTSDNINKIKPTVTNFGESEIEKQIMRLVEKHITPKMSKQDFLNIIEGDTKTAPAKPKEKEKQKPGHPFKPDPNKKGAPKAIKSEVGEGDTKTAPVKPGTKPGTTPIPKHPFQPDPNKKGAPKAMKKEVGETSLPSFLKFNQLGLKTK